jgi:nucleoside-diphosphate-sugar epimerase
MAQDIETFAGLARQYVFISSASAYETPPSQFFTTEAAPLANPYWQYSRDKAACEALLREAGEASGFPFTIVRPSHTYGYSDIPWGINSGTRPWTIIDRIRRGRPFIVHGDGSSLWTLTDHRDFAIGLVGLLGNPAALGEDFHITSDDVLTWNQIHFIVAGAAGIPPEMLAEQAIYIPSTLLARFDADAFEGPLMGDRTHPGIFDNAKLRTLVPEFATRHHFADAIGDSMEWFKADESRRAVDDDANALWDRVILKYQDAVDEMFP